MMRKLAVGLIAGATFMVTGARGGHELPIYPSFYPHEIAINTLLGRLPHLRLDGEPEWRGSFPLRELERLPVAWN